MFRAYYSLVTRSAHSRSDLVWLVALTAVAAALRASCLEQPISYDEAYTFLNFVARGGAHVFDYPVPNNHVFHTLLARASTVVFGHHLWSLRLPAFLAGVAAVPVAFALCQTLAGRSSGYLAAAALAVEPFLVMYSTLARGYSLVVLLTLMLALVGFREIERPSLAGGAVLSIIAALGLFTIPTMLFAIAGVYLWLTAVTVARGRGREAAMWLFVPGALMTVALTVLLYMPTIERAGVEALAANTFVQPLPWRMFVARLPAHYHDVVRQFSWNVHGLVLAACGTLIAIGTVDGIHRRDWPVAVLLPAMAVGGAVVLVARHTIPFARTWIYMIPFALVASDFGVAAIVRREPRFVRPALAACCIVAATSTAWQMAVAHEITNAADFPAGASLVQQLKTGMHDGDVVYVMSPIDWPAYYYLWYYRVPSLPTESGRGRSEFFIVDKHSYSLKDMTSQPVSLVADYQHAALYERRIVAAR